ncbi:hypothetical protein JCM5350_005754, partial [Sporobolomyces pararoseus]
ASTSATSTTESITNTISDAANYVKESVVGASAEQKKEADKAQAKDSSNSLTDRASAGISALGNKADESKADSKASAYKTSAQN